MAHSPLMSTEAAEAHRPRFIADLVPLVLELGCWWQRDLLRLASVSSCWLYYVRRELYCNPTVTSYQSCSLLSRTLRESPFLCPLVKGIHLRPTRLSTCYGRAVSKGVADIRCILGALDGLESVTLGGDLAVAAERFLNALANPEAVAHLHVDGTPANADSTFLSPSLEWDETLAYKLQGLRTLRLTWLELDIVQPLAPLPEVTDITLEHISITGDSLVEMVSTSSLKRVSVLTDGTDSTVEEQLQRLLEASCVEELRYEAEWNKAHTLSFMLPSTVVGSLCHLSLVGTHTCPTMVEMLGHCFPKLSDLFISGRATCITAEEWANVLGSSALPCLRELYIPNGTSLPPFRRWGASEEDIVTRQSAKRNVRLSFSSL